MQCFTHCFGAQAQRHKGSDSDCRARSEPLDSRCSDSPARHANHTDRLVSHRLWTLEFPCGRGAFGALAFWRGRMAVHPPYETIKSSGQHWFLGAHSISAGGLCGEPSWTAAAIPDSCGVVCPGTMVTHRVGFLGRSSPGEKGQRLVFTA